MKIYMDPDPLSTAANSIDRFQPTFEAFLSSEVSKVLGQNLKFELHLYNRSVPMDWLVENRKIDFYYGTAANAACLEASYSALPLVTIVKPMPGGGEIDGYGGAIVASSTNNRINTLQDIKGAVVGIEYQQGWGSNQLQVEALMRNGIYLYRDAKQIVTGNLQSNFAQLRMLDDVHSGVLDVAFIRADNINHFQSLNLTDSSFFKVIGALQNIMIPGTSKPYPFPASSQIYPEWSLVAFPWVEPTLEWQVLNSLLKINSSSYAAVRGAYSRWKPAVDYGRVRSVLEDTGVMVANATTGRRSCLWLETNYDVYSVPTCPPGSFKVLHGNAIQSCRDQNLTCPGPLCWCGVCKVAREVEVFAHGFAAGNRSLCDKMQPCAAGEQRQSFIVTVIDNLLRPGLRVSCALGDLGSAVANIAPLGPGNAPGSYSAVVTSNRVGMHLLQVCQAVEGPGPGTEPSIQK